MNSNQYLNILTTVVQLGMGALVTRGLVTGAEGDTVAGAIVALVTFFCTHNWHGGGTPPAANQPGIAPKAPLFAFALSLMLPFAGIAFVGCATSPQQVTYEAAGSTEVSVEVALAAYDQFAKAGKTSIAQNQAVAAAFAKYQAAFAVMCDAGAIYSATAATNVPAASAAFSIAISNADTELSDLENLIQSFGVTLTNNATITP